MASAADPRLPSAARPYVPPTVMAHELPPDYFGLLAIVCGILGLMFRNKIGSWLAVIFCAQSIANMKNLENDLKQVLMAFTFVVMGMVTHYSRAAPSS